MYVKPLNAGKKSHVQNRKRRATQPEPELFTNRVQLQGTLLKLRKSSVDNQWSVTSSQCDDVDPLSPDRDGLKLLQLVARSDKLCPKMVKRCESCRFNFETTDTVVIKSVGIREFTNSDGKRIKQKANVYIHYLTNCLKEFDDDFSFSKITVPKSTQIILGTASCSRLQAKGCKLL